MLEQYHVDWKGTRPMDRLREAYRVMRSFLDEGAIDFEDEFYTYTGLFSSKARAGAGTAQDRRYGWAQVV